MNVSENLRIALSSMRANKLRTVLTILIITLGITAIVGMVTAVDALRGSITDSFSALGANTFNIRNRGSNIHFGRSGRRNTVYRNISYTEAKDFDESYHFPSRVSITVNCTQNAVLKYDDVKTNPNIMVIGGNGNYLANTGLKIGTGRNFSDNELTYGVPVCIVGVEIVEQLFGKQKLEPLDQVILINDHRHRIVGVLRKAGSSLGMNPDRWCIIPLNNARFEYVSEYSSYAVTVAVTDAEKLEPAIDEANGVMRRARNLRVSEENNFQITRTDSFTAALDDQIKYVKWFGIIIGVITLLGATIGLMNIMLVSVTERTSEIGIRKALGAKAKTIMNQFLIEALVICQFGGLFGVFFGLLIGFAVAMLFKTSFIMPWLWVVIAFMICTVVGLIAGFVPARKAARLDPIESLRYE